MVAGESLWLSAKELAEHASGWPTDTLHVIGGVLLQLLLVAWLGRGLADGRPVLLVLILELVNEAHDLWVERWPSLPMQVGEGLRDLVGTLLLPTVLWLVARHRPLWLVKRS
jgi:hypothetical protein